MIFKKYPGAVIGPPERSVASVSRLKLRSATRRFQEKAGPSVDALADVKAKA
jgi:hypothetical protein